LLYPDGKLSVHVLQHPLMHSFLVDDFCKYKDYEGFNNGIIIFLFV